MNHISFINSFHPFTTITSFLTKQNPKERTEIIVEPFQALIQLALLSFCPKHTKLSIEKNILQLQLPHIHQGVMRWYNNDTKNDLVFLFHAIKRFQIFYKKMLVDNPKLYHIIIKYASNGILQLQQTYESSQNMTLVQTLRMYHSMLLGRIDFSHVDGPRRETTKKKNMYKNEILHDNRSIRSCSFESARSSPRSILASSSPKSEAEEVNIETIFSSITKIYPKELHNIIYNVFVMLENNDITYNNAIHVISRVFKKYDVVIHNWIIDHLVF